MLTLALIFQVAVTAINPPLPARTPPTLVEPIKHANYDKEILQPFYAKRDEALAKSETDCITQGGEPDRFSCAMPEPVAETGFGGGTPVAPVMSPVASYQEVGSAENTYVWGQCVWYIATKRSVPNNWGNANQWLANAQAAGWATGSAPRAGAIAWTGAGYYGHVAYVESVNTDGTVFISEMNFDGGVGVLHYRTTPASDWFYIY